MRESTPSLTRKDAAGMSSGEYNEIGWVKPILLCEVAFTEWTNDGRIRHPSFQGLREDKDASQVKQEIPDRTPTETTLKKSARNADPEIVLSGVRITHPDRVISKTGHITKRDVAEYYSAIAPYLLAQIGNHPLSLLRCPAGIDGECFFQRNPGRGLGPHVHAFKFANKGKNYQYLYIDDERGLLELIQMGVIEIHPWGASVKNIDFPDRMIFDLDPAPDVSFDTVKAAAQELRKRLRKNGLESIVKCTGGKGLHVTVPLAAKNSWDEVKQFAASLAAEMASANPQSYVATMSKAKRAGRIFLDYFRNDYTATAIADYAVRARPGTPVALPIEWRELSGLSSASSFSMKDVVARVKKRAPASLIKVAGQTL
jgi:bifunctional non-homologous end joining protein LigD